MWHAKAEGYAVGLMSGTSGDGIDAALVAFEEREGAEFPLMRLEHSFYRPYSEMEREQVFALFDPEVSAKFVAEMHVRMGDWFAEAVAGLIRESGVDPADIAVIGSHGQTVCHYPELSTTLQIGDPTRIAFRTGVPVVSDFRRQDLAAGGQGAPLIPYFDYGYLSSEHVMRVALNIGGIANVTILPPCGGLEDVLAYDTGPGNMVLDGAVQILTDGAFRCDEDGALAAQGQVHEALLNQWLATDTYVSALPPKSTGRELYGRTFVEARLCEMAGLSTPDQLATLTALVAETVASNLRRSVREEMELFISGGGQHNKTLVQWIVERARPVRLLTTDSIGIPSDMKEAMAFALFAWQFTHGRKVNVPSATGATRAVMLGQWTPAL